jgi:hypothetical protein
VIVQAPEIQADKYESNDDVAHSYKLPVSFSGNKASVKTDDSNLHHGEDYDYYKIELPAGQNYTFKVRLHDKGNSGNGITYTADAIFCYSLNGAEGSQVYDDIMPGSVTVTNGGTVYFAVAPYFAGEKGSYLLDIEIEKGVTGINDIQTESALQVYPNPTAGELNIETDGQIRTIQIFNVSGKQVFETNQIHFDIAHLPAGTYIVAVQTERGISRQKIVKR